MATEENVNPTEGQEQENDYRETLLVRNPDSGQVEAVSKLVTKGDRREVHTMQDRKSTRLNSSHIEESRMPSSA